MVISISFDTSQTSIHYENISNNSLYDSMTSLKGDLFNISISGTQYFSVYDTAYLSLVKNSNNMPTFSRTLDFIVQSMHDDYSWGNPHILSDSILSTLASIYAIQESRLVNTFQGQKILNRAKEFVYDKYPYISKEPFFTSGFEFIVPNLIQKTDIQLENHSVTKELLKNQHKKLSMIPIEYIEKKKTPMLFALESLDELGITTSLDHFIESNGSIATSPSTTAWYLNHNNKSEKKSDMMDYLNSVYNNTRGTVPSFADYALMNIPFVLYPLFKAGIVHPSTLDLLNYVMEHWTPVGVGHSAFFPLTDADDTALNLLLLNNYNLIGDKDERFESLKAFYKNEHFVTYPWEMGASNMVNIHVLDMYLESSYQCNNRQMMINQLVTYIEKQISYSKGIGGDKYHHSPYCQNTHAVLALAKNYPEISRKLIDWFIVNQDENGLWGTNGPNIEETAYAVMSLCYYHINAEKIDLNILFNAIDYLVKNDNPYPDLWLSKVAYTPIETVQAHILSALELYRQAV